MTVLSSLYHNKILHLYVPGHPITWKLGNSIHFLICRQDGFIVPSEEVARSEKGQGS